MKEPTVGETRRVRVIHTAAASPVGSDGENTYSVHGDVEIGEEYNVRVIADSGDGFVAVTSGAELELRVDETGDEGTSKAHPDFGPVHIPASLTVGTWWRCRVSEIHDTHLVATTQGKIPRRSHIGSGPLPGDYTQSLNHHLNPKETDS